MTRLFAVLVLLFLIQSPAAFAQSAVTVAGGTYGDGQPAKEVPLYSPIDVDVDSRGNIFFFESYPQSDDVSKKNLRRIDKSTGKIWTVAGARPRPGVMPNWMEQGNGPRGNGRVASDKHVSFDIVKCFTFDKNDNIYIADEEEIRIIDAKTGYISSFLGIEASSLVFDDEGNLFIGTSSKVWKTDFKHPDLILVAGGKRIYDPYLGYEVSYGYMGDGNIATDAQLGSPDALKFDKDGNLLIADGGFGVIRKVDKETNIITTFADLGVGSYLQDLQVDKQGNIYFSSGRAGSGDENVIKRIDHETNVVTTIAGGTSNDYAGEDVPATSVRLGWPIGMCFDSNGDLIFADAYLNLLRKVELSTGLISTFAGSSTYEENVPATQVVLDKPVDICFDLAGDLYIADQGNGVVRRVDHDTNLLKTVAGGGYEAHIDGINPKDTWFLRLQGVAISPTGEVYIAIGNRIIRINQETGLTEAVVKEVNPSKMIFDQNGDMYFINNGNSNFSDAVAVVKFSPESGESTIVAGSATGSYFEEGILATSMYFDSFIDDIEIDGSGTLYIKSDWFIYKVDKNNGVLKRLLTVPRNTSMCLSVDNRVYILKSDLDDTYTIYNSVLSRLNNNGSLTTVYDGLTMPLTNLCVDRAGIFYASVSEQVGTSVFRNEDRIVRIDARDPQSIMFALADEVPNAGHNFNAAASSGLPIRYEVADSTLLTISDEGHATVHAIGTTFVIAHQDGNENFAPAIPVTQFVKTVVVTESQHPNVGISHLYPNPSTGPFYAEVTELSPVIFSVYSSTGKVVKTGLAYPTDYLVSFDLSDLKKGLYLIKMQSDTKTTFQRIATE